MTTNFAQRLFLALAAFGSLLAAHEPALAEPAHGPAAKPIAEATIPKDWAYLDNGQIRLGVKKTSGAGIAYLSASGSTKNLLNHYDHGRLVQQSYYGNPDGSLWNKKPWRWNPVQGGDWRGKPSEILEFRADARSLYSKIEPCHWASGERLHDVVMEQWIDLDGRIAHARMKMTYKGQTEHRSTHQEVPAFFAEPELSTLVVYDGAKPWTGGPLNRSRPGWPNEGRRMTEHWAAYVDEKDFGVGAYVPIADRLTCYRFQGGKSSCSYFAPLINLAIKPGTVFEYDLYLATGTVTEMREAFQRIAQAAPKL